MSALTTSTVSETKSDVIGPPKPVRRYIPVSTDNGAKPNKNQEVTPSSHSATEKPNNEPEENTSGCPVPLPAAEKDLFTVRESTETIVRDCNDPSESAASPLPDPPSDSPRMYRNPSVQNITVDITEAGALVQFKYLERTQLLGEGSFGYVYAGQYFEQPVAIKELKDAKTISVEALDEFYHEAKLHFNIRHKNIVALLCFNVDRDLGSICMVMEKLKCSLHDVLHENSRESKILSFNLKLEMIEDMAKGMHYLHSVGIMHLDIKSMNMLLDDQGVIKIADFGLSRVKQEIKNDPDDEECPSGSIPWMAPELMTGSKPTFKSDVYSFYVLMWEVMTESKPHDRKSPMKIIQFVSKKKKKLPMPPSMPQQLESLFDDCSDIDPEKRPTMQKVCERLREVRANPLYRVRALTTLSDRPPYQYILNDPSSVLEVLDSPNGQKVGSTVTGKKLFNVKEHTLVKRAVLGKQDQIFLQLAEPNGWVSIFCRDTGKLLVEQIQGPENERVMVNKAAEQGVEYFSTMFRTHISNKNAVSTGCLKIMAFLADPDALKPLVAAGTVQTLVIALKSYPEYEMVHSNALAVLHNLAASSEKMLCRTQMCDAGIIGVLQRDFARDDLEQNVDVLFNMLSLVRMISELPTMVKALGILCSDIIKLVTRFRGRERFQQIGWGCVFQMTKDCPENREKFMNLGACQELCLAMVSFMENRIVYDILLAVHGISIQNGASQDALVDAGAFEAVVKIMGHFAEDLKMTTICTYVLNNTVPNNERNGEKLRVTGVCRAIVNSLPVMMSDSKSFPSSIHTVRTLWLSVDNRPGLIDAGVCLQFWRALESLSQNENISVYIVNMLMNFSVDTTAAHKIVKDVNWEVYFTNIKKFPRNIQLQEYGLSVIANILCKVNDEKVKEIFGGAGACEAAMLALLNHLDSPKVLESALKTTYILSRQSEPNCERFRALNVRSMVQEAVEKHREVKVIDDLCKACFSIL